MSGQSLVVEWRAKREWLRSNPTGAGAAVTKRRLKQLEREIKELRLDLEQAALSSATAWWVTASGVGRSRHLDRQCLHLSDSVVREATEAELLDLPICSTCG